MGMMWYLSESVGQGFDHDVPIVVPLSLELLTQLLGSEYAHGEQADVVRHAAVQGRDEVGQGQVGL